MAKNFITIKEDSYDEFVEKNLLLLLILLELIAKKKLETLYKNEEETLRCDSCLFLLCCRRQ